MNKRIILSAVIILLFSLYACKKEEVPVVSTTAVSNLTATTAMSGGSITSEGSSTVTSRGVCWSTNNTPTVADSKTNDGAGAGSFTSNITGLNGATVYYVRAYATNGVGTGYGMAMSFSTLGEVPATVTSAASDITTSSATFNGIVNANFLSTTVTFEYGTSTEYGQSVIASQSPVTGITTTNVSANITGLAAGTAYHLRIKAVNSLGETYSNDLTFTTLGQVPTVATLASTSITSTGATFNGTVNANYLSTVVTFEYGTTTSYGITETATQSPVTGSANNNLNLSITGLTAGTIYHYRIKAENSLGMSYGNDISFYTPSKVTDIDGNTYNTVLIGNQIWMSENLKTTRFSDGTAIPFVNTDGAWSALISDLNGKAYGWQHNDISYKDTYGALYTWGAAMNGATTTISIPSGIQGVCPVGWHLPSDREWDTLAIFVNGDGGKLKEKGLSHWLSPNTGATNETGFNGLPGGQRFIDGSSVNLGEGGYWWSTTEYSSSFGFYRALSRVNNFIDRSSYYKSLGHSVRCIKD